jgi:hypothetical protein
MKLGDPVKTVKALIGDQVLNRPLLRESGTLGVTRRHCYPGKPARKRRLQGREGFIAGLAGRKEKRQNFDLCPSAAFVRSNRYGDDPAKRLKQRTTSVGGNGLPILGQDWPFDYVAKANDGGINRCWRTTSSAPFYVTLATFGRPAKLVRRCPGWCVR